MSALLRHPDLVPALFSRAMDADVPMDATRSSIWTPAVAGAPRFVAVAALGRAVLLIDVPLVKAADAVRRAPRAIRR